MAFQRSAGHAAQASKGFKVFDSTSTKTQSSTDIVIQRRWDVK